MTHEYIFFLGREPELSAAEIRAVFAFFKLRDVTVVYTPPYVFTSCTHELNVEHLMNRLGGTVKIGKKITHSNEPTTAICAYLDEQFPDGKISFSVTGAHAKALALAVKKRLKSDGRSVRYIEPKNSATILHNNLIEKQSDLTRIGEDIYASVALQPFEEFGERDFGRPGRDAKSGMLPPKLARMMINLAEVKETDTLLDPFCGSGTILSEALLMGYTHLLGSDLSDKAVDDTKKNLAWTASQQALTLPQIPVIHCDVRKLPEQLNKQTVDAIVTEPFLGKPLTGKETSVEMQKQAQELQQLYISAFTAFAKLLKKDGTVIFVFPSFKHGTNWITTVPKDAIEKLGFRAVPLDTATPYLRYVRPNQFLARDIWKWTFKGK